MRGHGGGGGVGACGSWRRRFGVDGVGFTFLR